MGLRWGSFLASALAVAGLVTLAEPSESGKEARAATSLDSLVAELDDAPGKRTGRSDPRRERRGKAQRMPSPGEAPVPLPPGCTSFADQSTDCSDLPRDGCVVPAVRVPGEIDCSRLPRRACSKLIGPEGAALAPCRPSAGPPDGP